MASGSYRFERFLFDLSDRRLRRDGAPVELNARYLDALALLVREHGKLVSKDRFFEEVWRGVPVTDEALTQCVRTLRRQLGDDAARPLFIETIPKHGYRFIAPVEPIDEVQPPQEASSPSAMSRFLLLGAAGTAGGGIAGVVGGIFYGFVGAEQPGMGAASVLLVLVCVTTLIALVGAAGVAFGIAAASFLPDRAGLWKIAGGAAGGLVVGAVVKLLGTDAFNLLLGRSPGDITGAAEGALLGAAVGLGGWLAHRSVPSRPFGRAFVFAALTGGAAGVLVSLLGGRLLGGSLALLASHFPASRLRLDQIGRLLGEDGFGLISRMTTGALEAALFSACIVAAMMVVRRHLGEGRS